MNYELAVSWKQFIMALFALWITSSSSWAEGATSTKGRERQQVRTQHAELLCQLELPAFVSKLDQYVGGLSHDQSCPTRMLYLESVLECRPKAEVLEWIKGEVRGHWDCLSHKQQFFFAGYSGQKFYEAGRVDSALYYANMASDIAFAASDTSRFVVSLSNLAVLFTEIRWYPEALSSVIWAYDLSRASSDTSSQFFAYVVNNLVSAHLDMGHVEHAAQLTPRYASLVGKYGNSELREFWYLNTFRVQCLSDPKKAFERWLVESPQKSDSLRSKMVHFLSAVAGKLPVSDRAKLEIELADLMLKGNLSPRIKLNYVVPALSTLSTIPIGIRKELLELELLLDSKNVFVKRDFYEVMAQALQSNEYWDKFRESVHDVDSASNLYAVVYSDILRSINMEALQEHQAATYGQSLIAFGKVLLVVVVLCAVGLVFGIFRVLKLRTKALDSLNELKRSQEQLRETEVRHDIMVEQLKELANRRGYSVRKGSLAEILEMHSGSEVREREQLRSWMETYGLTRTEAEVLARIALGWDNIDLVADLNLAKSYVHNIRGQIRRKLEIPKNLTIEEFVQEMLRS